MNQTLQQRLKLELPIIQAPMAGVQGSALAIAVSTAGGLGSLPCAMLSPAQMRAELGLIAAACDNRVNVNFFCHQPQPADARREQQWRDELAGYYREYAIDADAIAPAQGRTPFDAAALAVLQEFRPAVVSFHFGLPERDLLADTRSRGTGASSREPERGAAHVER